MNSTSDKRQRGQSSPFTTSSSQKVHGMRDYCRGSIVAEIERPSLVEHQRLISNAVCFLDSGKITLGCFDGRPIQNRPLEETNLLWLAKFEYEPTHRFAAVCTLLYSVAHSHSSSTPHMNMPHAHDASCCSSCCWAWL